MILDIRERDLWEAADNPLANSAYKRASAIENKAKPWR